MRRRTFMATSAGVLLAPALAPSRALAADGIVGAGSNVANPIMKRWVELARTQAGMNVTYDPIGSGPGQNKILAGEIDFAVSLMPMPEESLEQASLSQFPVTLAAVTCMVNLPGVGPNKLRLNGVVLGEIYTKSIKKWNDPKLVALNPGLPLPDMDIQPVFNVELIGSTFVFTQYLLANNEDWRARHGTRVTKRWAAGSMVTSNSTMAEVIKVLPGSIGYMDHDAVVSNKFTTVLLQNKAGKYVAPEAASFAATAAAADWANAPKAVVQLVNQPGDNSWPLMTANYVQYRKATPQGEQVRRFFDIAFTKGDDAVTQANATPLSAAAKTVVRDLWNKVGV